MYLRYCFYSLVLGVLMCVAQSAKADSVLVLNVGATYLHTVDDPDAQNTIPVSLSSLGLKPGDEISMQAFGEFCYYKPNCFLIILPPQPFMGLFSSSSTLLAASVTNRVPGAIG